MGRVDSWRGDAECLYLTGRTIPGSMGGGAARTFVFGRPGKLLEAWVEVWCELLVVCVEVRCWVFAFDEPGVLPGAGVGLLIS